MSTDAEGTTDCRCGTTKQMLMMDDGSHGGRGGDLIYARRFGDILRREISRMEIEEWLRKTKHAYSTASPRRGAVANGHVARTRRTAQRHPQRRRPPPG